MNNQEKDQEEVIEDGNNVIPAPQSGLTPRSFLMLMYSLVVFMPAIIWMTLATNSWFQIGWVIFFLFTELTMYSKIKPTPAEGAVLLTISGALKLQFQIFSMLIYRGYFYRSDIAKMFNLVPYMPDWWVSKNDLAWINRTFFDPSWLIPIMIAVSLAFLNLLADIAMGLLTRELYIKAERLPFPMQHVSAEGIVTLTERPRERMNILITGVNIGMIYALILYGVPIITELFGFEALSVAPIPWYDMNTLIHYFLPGASFGIATSLLVFVQGFVIPFNVVISIFIASMAIHVIGNYLLVTMGWTGFATEWFRGMNIGDTWARSYMHAWMGPWVGVSLAAALMPIVHHREYLVKALKGLAKTSLLEKGEISLIWILGLWLGATLSSIGLVYYFVPGYPLWIMVLFSIGWSFIWSLMTARAIGETGVSIQPPSILPLFKYSYIAVTGYPEKDIWFIDPVISQGGAGWCANFKICELVGCSIKSYIKAYLLGWPIAIIVGFFFMQIFWNAAPIPSSAYPATTIYWPLQAINTSMWVSGRLFTEFDPLYVGYAFILTAIIYGITQITRLPLSVMGIAVGMQTPIPVAFSMLIGGIIGKIVRKFVGERWREIRVLIAAGATLGTAVALTILTSIMILVKSLWTLPY